MEDRKSYHAPSRSAWREWLMNNHQKEDHVWLIIYKQKSKIPSVRYKEAVKEALCFGWIDSVPNKRDDLSYFQYFSKRNPKSNWSRVNKNYVEELLGQGLIHDSGLISIELAKASGTWDALNDVDDLTVPDDLKAEFKKYPKSQENFSNFPPSVRRGILEWIFNAKRKETRNKRLQETASLAAKNIRANQYTRK